jgi:hypothetical protein
MARAAFARSCQTQSRDKIQWLRMDVENTPACGQTQIGKKGPSPSGDGRNDGVRRSRHQSARNEVPPIDRLASG